MSDKKSEEKSEEKNDEKIAPVVAGAARVGVAAAKNPAVRGAVGGAVQGMMKKRIDEPFEMAWELMKSNREEGMPPLPYCEDCGERCKNYDFDFTDAGPRCTNCQPKVKKSDEKGDNAPTNPGLWSQAKSKARSKFKVYPSAYANGWASKWYKSKGGGWKKKSKK